jgi:hypothetical protein
LETKILYDQGVNAVTAQSLFIIVTLGLVTAGCFGAMYIRRRQGKLSPELRWVLLTAGVLTGVTMLLFGLSALPDLITPPTVDRGRINKIYERRISAGDTPITRVVLSNGADLQVPDGLVPELQAGACVELTRTASTGYILIARQLPVDACLK